MPGFPPSPTLLPPRRSLEDPGARDLGEELLIGPADSFGYNQVD